MRHSSLILIVIIALLALISCSRAGQPVVPSNTGSIATHFTDKDLSLPVGVTDFVQDQTPAGGVGALGIFELILDEKNVSAELIPLRKSALPDVLEVVDITNFLMLAPCSDCAKISSVSLNNDGDLVVNIGIKHPFAAGDPFKPITGRNRGDLHVFNVEGIVVSNSTTVPFPGVGESIADFKLLSSDGYSGYLDSVIDEFYPTDATIHPYVLHFDDYSEGNFSAGNPMGFESVTDPPPSGNLVMAMGCDYNYQDYIFDLSSGQIDFIYAIGCTYAVSAASKIQRFNPEYRIPQHNKKAASEVWLEIVQNDLKGEDNSSSADLEIKVLDMSHDVETGDSLDQMLADSSVGEIAVEIPGVTSGSVVDSSPVPIGGDGRDPLNPLSYSVSVTNDSEGPEGTYWGLVKVTDTYTPGQNTLPLLDSMDGIERVDPVQNPLEGLFVIDEFATYASFSIDVAPGITNPTACFTTEPVGDPDLEIPGCSTVSFDASCSTDDSAITLYEWDFDWDGYPANFNDDTGGANQTVITRFFGVEGVFEVALRVTDDESPGLTDITSIVVTVTSGGNETITNENTTVVNLDRRYYIDMIATYENWVYVLNRGTYNGDQGLWVYVSCGLGDGWLDPVQVSEDSSDDTPRACGMDITADGRCVVAWIDAQNDACIAIADDETASSWSTKQEVFTQGTNLPNADVACHPSDPDYAVISFTRYDVPSGTPQRIYSSWTNNLTSWPPTWNPCGSGTYVGYWTIWNVQDVNSEFTTDGELDQIVWRLWPTTSIGNMIYHRRWTPGGTYGTWSGCCGYVSPNGAPDYSLIKSSPDLFVDNQNRPVVVYAQADNKSGGTAYPPWRLFINRGTDEFRPLFPAPVELAVSSAGNVDKPSISQDPNTGNYWIVYNSYDTDPSTPSQIFRATVDESLSVLDVDLLWSDNDQSNTYDDRYPHITYAADSGVERMITIWRNDNDPNPNIMHRLDDL